MMFFLMVILTSACAKQATVQPMIVEVVNPCPTGYELMTSSRETRSTNYRFGSWSSVGGNGRETVTRRCVKVAPVVQTAPQPPVFVTAVPSHVAAYEVNVEELQQTQWAIMEEEVAVQKRALEISKSRRDEIALALATAKDDLAAARRLGADILRKARRVAYLEALLSEMADVTNSLIDQIEADQNGGVN